MLLFCQEFCGDNQKVFRRKIAEAACPRAIVYIIQFLSAFFFALIKWKSQHSAPSPIVPALSKRIFGISPEKAILSFSQYTWQSSGQPFSVQMS